MLRIRGFSEDALYNWRFTSLYIKIQTKLKICNNVSAVYYYEHSTYLRGFHNGLLINKLAPRSKVTFDITSIIVSMTTTFVTFPFLHCFKHCYTWQHSIVQSLHDHTVHHWPQTQLHYLKCYIYIMHLFTIHRESKKQDTKLLPIISPNINQFLIFFTDGLCSKFATNSWLNIPLCPKHVATLPCKIWSQKNGVNLKYVL